MRTRVYFLAMFAAAVIIFASCENETVQPNNGSDILPEKFKVDIPNSLSNNNYKNATLKSTAGDTLNGNEIYENLSHFIAIGEGAADIVEAIIWHIRVYNIQSVIELTYTSDDDNRIKKLVVESGVTYLNRTWDYALTITDLESAGNEDGGKGMQVFWNPNPVEGIALIKPYNLDRVHDADAQDAMFGIEYSSKGIGNYEEYMIVEIANLPLANATVDPFSVDNIKMFVGKKDDVVDVYGNSNHPNAQFFTDKTGFNWAFVASGNQQTDLGVAEVGLPPSTLDATSRDIILGEYSIKSVLTNEINEWFLDTYGVRPDSSDLAGYLKNADAPGYFDADGFVQGGVAPNENYGDLDTRILSLTPYNPMDISEIEINFK